MINHTDSWWEELCNAVLSSRERHIYETTPIAERPLSKEWRKADEKIVTELRNRAYSKKGKTSVEVITDTMDLTKNPIDGKHYDSKAKYYRTVRQAGCEIAGNDPAISRPRAEKELSSSERKRDIARALGS
jgi:hypothetical protein